MDEQSPRVDVQQAEDGLRAVLQGDWIAADLTERGTWAQVQAALTKAAGQSPTWVLPDEMEMDHLGAIALWRAWGERLPDRLQASDDQKALIARVAEYACEPPPAEPGGLRSRVRVALNRVWERLSQRAGEMRDFTQVVGQVYLDLWRFAGNLRMGPWRDISSHLYRVGGTAMPITALVGFLIGVVLAYLMSQVLRQFGAEIFIVNILGLALIRELGPILAAVLIAGRSGSSITAQIGVMRVTEELDAMRVMGIPISYRLSCRACWRWRWPCR